MDQHFDKDLQYHQTIAREYDEVVVAPRLVTNNALYKKFAHFMSGNRMLDLGCGTGHMSLRFGKYFKEVVAVDHSEAMLERARSKSAAAGLKNVQFICKSVFDYIETAPPDSFDAVCCTGFLHHLKPDEIGPAIRKFARVMTNKAVMLTSEPIRVDPNSVPPRIRDWNATSIAMRLHYSQHAEPPDEAPIEKDVLTGALESAGLRIAQTSRNWEIFPRQLPPSTWDILAIRSLNYFYGQNGNVFTVVAQNRAPGK